MPLLADRIATLLVKHQLLGAILARENGEVVLRAGVLEHSAFTWLVKESFGSPDAARTLHRVLQGKPLPQLSRQGTAYSALACAGPWVWGLFVLKERPGAMADFHARMRLASEAVRAEVEHDSQ